MPFNALNFTDMAKTAYDQGRQTGRQMAVQNALKEYAKDPAATQNALVGIGAFDEAKQVGDARQSVNREKVGSLAASGDMAGARTAALGAGDFDAAAHIGQMSAQDIAAAEKKADTFGAVGVKLKSYPYEQRKAALAQLAPWLEEQGFTADMIAKFDPNDANIDGIIGQAQTTKEALAARKTQIVNRGNGAYDVVAEDGGDLVRSVEGRPQGKTVTLKDAAGNEAVYVIDEATGQPIAAPQGQGGEVSAPGSLAARNNNPGNLRPDGSQWQGMTGEAGGFVQFDTPENGMRAARVNLGNQAKLHGIDNLNDLFAKWAPASDSNDPVAYAKSVSQMTGIDPNATIDLTDPAIQDKILPAIAKVEGGGTPSPQGQRPAGGVQPVIAAPGFGSGVNPKEQKAQMAQDKADRQGQMNLRKEFDALPDVKNYNIIATQYGAMKKAAAGKTPSDDIALIFNYMKMLDPTSVVREGEFATAQQTGGIPSNVVNAYNRALSGNRLNDGQRANYLKTAASLHTNARERYDEITGQYRDYATEGGYDPEKTFKTRANPDAAQSSGTNGYTPEQVAAHQVLKKQDPSWNSAQGFQRIPRTKAEYDRIKPGEHYLDTDGVVKEKR